MKLAGEIQTFPFAIRLVRGDLQSDNLNSRHQSKTSYYIDVNVLIFDVFWDHLLI